MHKISALIFAFCIVAGCQTSQTSSESEYDRISRKIEKLKTESQAAGSFGDNIKIVVNFFATSITDRFAVDSLWQYVDKNVAIIKRPEVFSRSGLKIGVADENFRMRLDITKQQLKSSEETEIFVVLSDGTTGYINVGKEISVPRFYYLGLWYSSVGYEFRQAGRSLKVTARKLPSGLIDMELTPVFSKFLSDGGDLELTELSTRVTSQPGKALVIGGGDSSEEDVATALLSYSKYGEQKQTLITVTPYVQ
jgi:type II secretory pathway component GspD/PulD (secretin)